jgi:hypothetical protein
MKMIQKAKVKQVRKETDVIREKNSLNLLKEKNKDAKV